MNKFKAGQIWRHDTAQDLDILVVKVRYEDKGRSKLLIKWVSQNSGTIQMFPGGRVDGTDNITINSKDYLYWKLKGG
jgi:hypothetical protein